MDLLFPNNKDLVNLDIPNNNKSIECDRWINGSNDGYSWNRSDCKTNERGKTQAEVNAAIGELNSKLASIQRECVSLVELVGTYQEINASLKAKIAEFENFEAQTEGYILNQLESGTFVYWRR